MRPEFAPAIWEAFRRFALDGLPASQVAAELGLTRQRRDPGQVSNPQEVTRRGGGSPEIILRIRDRSPAQPTSLYWS